MDDLELYDTFYCPCCKRYRNKSHVTSLIHWHRQHKFFHLISIIGAARQELLNWACDECLSKKIAIQGNPENQNWGGFAYPFFAYYDQEKICETCKTKFIFSKEEQKYWYEGLKFIVWSTPKNCLTCRKAIREPKEMNKILSELIKNLQPDNIDQLESIIDIYLKLDKIEKAKYYFSIVRKNIKPEMQKRLETIKQKINNYA